MYNSFEDKNGDLWYTAETWAEFGIVENGTTKMLATCPICSSGRTDANKAQKCLSVNFERGTARCSHHGERFMISKEYNPNHRKEENKLQIKKVYVKPKNDIKHDIPENLLLFLYNRGITDDVIKRNKLGHDVKWFGKSKRKDSCISFPYYKDGEMVALKYRLPEPKDWTAESNGEPIVYGYDDITKDWMIWVEGELDKLAVEVAGFKNCVSVPNGAKSAGCLDNIVDKIKDVKTHIIAVDNDLDGSELKNDLIKRLNPAKCRTVKFIEGCKDANDVLKEHGDDILKRCIEDSEKYPIKGIVKPSALINKLLDVYRTGVDSGLSTGWVNIDKLYRVKKGQWTVVTGIPNHGKSEFLDALIINMIKLHKWKFGVFSPENYPLESHMAKFLRKFTNKPFGKAYNGAMPENEVVEGAKWFDDYMSFVAVDEDIYTMEMLLKKTEELILSEGIDGMIIDPWNTIEHNRPNNMSETEYTSSALSKITYLVRKYNIHVWIVAHPTKLQKNSKGKYPPPMPYDISGSAHWNNKTDNAITVHIEKSDDRPVNEVQIHVNKIRFRENGQPGQTELYYNITSGRYSNKA